MSGVADADGAVADEGDWYAALVAGEHVGEWLARWISLGGALSSFGLLNTLLCAAARIVVSAAELGVLPSSLATVDARSGSPVNAILALSAGLLLVLSTSISHDLMKKIIKPNISDKEEMLYARLASFGSLAIAAYFGINPPSSFVAETVAFAFGIAASTFFPTLILGIFSKRINRAGAMAGMVAGLVFTTGYIIYFQFITGSTDYLFGIKPSGIGFLGMLLNFLVSGIVSQFTAPLPEDVKAMVEEIRIPKGAGAAQDH